MPPKGKPKARTFKSTSSSKLSATASNDPPPPFTRPDPKLAPFLEKLSKYHIYITHIDKHPKDFKQKIFAVPVAMNLLIIAGLLWRASSIFPYYMKICFSLMGKQNETTIDTASMPLNDVIFEILRRAAIFIVDLILYVLIWPWPRDFFFGTAMANPIAWRWGVGFREKEIIVRRSRKWTQTVGDFFKEDNEEGNQLLQENVRKAVEPMWMAEKTGYLMLNKEWDLDWRAMVQATKLVDRKTMDLSDFQTTIYAWHADYEWMVIKTAKAGGSAKEEQGRQKIVAFKEALTALGKESLFFRWIELVQFESSGPEGFGPEQQKKAMVKAKELFEAQGIDFDAFWEKIGGMDGMPGMDQD